MRIATRFWWIQALWTLPFVGLMPALLAVTGSEPMSAMQLARWTAHAIGLAAYPAGIATSGALLGQRQARRLVAGLALALAVSAVVVFLVLAVLAPRLPGGAQTLPELARAMNDPLLGWEARNHAAWALSITFYEPLTVLLLGGIGIQVGLWAGYGVPRLLHGMLFWAVGLGLLLSGYMVFDGTYEAIVIHTDGPVGFAAVYTLMIPAGLCAGLALPTLALLRGANLRGDAA